jgi:PIN domain nuclease of toxin-antitoxin system
VRRVLLDTHALVWWLEGRDKLSRHARRVIEDREISILVSAASACELAIKTQLGKLKSRDLVRSLNREVQEEGFAELPISIDHALLAGSLSGPHKDPLDRMLIAQARSENIPVVSADELFDDRRVRRLW